MSEANLAVGGHSELMEQSPFAIPSRKLAIWLFIIADAMTFAAVLIAYGFLRNASASWPRPFHSSVNVAIMTFILITSSLTMLLAVQAARQARRNSAIAWILATTGLGVIFAFLHIREWLALIDEGMTLSKNPWGDPLFGAAFFGVTGLHLLHVVGGILALLGVTLAYKSGRYNADHVETAGLYWHFVDLVWMFVVPMIYLLNLSH
ncbi:MAG TPA: cytochrome c oxidase subunit 3 [Verrucomicrobiae bacterium]|nr:cytochrome c oxidase subunit 3 [Verrucomicrobiae bacterium]